MNSVANEMIHFDTISQWFACVLPLIFIFNAQIEIMFSFLDFMPFLQHLFNTICLARF